MKKSTRVCPSVERAHCRRGGAHLSRSSPHPLPESSFGHDRLPGRHTWRAGPSSIDARHVPTLAALALPLLEVSNVKSWDVVVVGAGAAGLAAAAQMSEAGARVIVVEARARAGGRILTRRPQRHRCGSHRERTPRREASPPLVRGGFSFHWRSGARGVARRPRARAAKRERERRGTEDPRGCALVRTPKGSAG